jgi:dTDP-4-dehydrorhamnose 3,5-epimerase
MSELGQGFRIERTRLPGVLILHPRIFSDQRGFFLESYNERVMAEAGITQRFVQDNHSYSTKNVLRGLHYQYERPQGKLIRVVSGEILDVAVDLRRSSPMLGKWVSVLLSGERKNMFWLPVGVAHGFLVCSENAHVLYKATDFYDVTAERTIAWNDHDLKIDWRLESAPLISAKDAQGMAFREAPKFE